MDTGDQAESTGWTFRSGEAEGVALRFPSGHLAMELRLPLQRPMRRGKEAWKVFFEQWQDISRVILAYLVEQGYRPEALGQDPNQNGKDTKRRKGPYESMKAQLEAHEVILKQVQESLKELQKQTPSQ